MDENQLDSIGRPLIHTGSAVNYTASAIRVYNGNPNLKSAGVPINFEPWQVEEWIKCQEDPIYFIENYIKVVTIDHGLQPMKLYDFQKKIVRGILIESSRVVATVGRQSGKSTVMAAAFVHYVLFNELKTCAILANKAATAREILGRVQLAYEHLPKWLQQGVLEWNKGSFLLENGSRVLASSTSSSAIRGYSCVAGETNICLEEEDSFFFVPIEKSLNIDLKSDNLSKRHNLVYKTTNILDGKYYIGIHSTDDMEDGYLGSGKIIRRAIIKYGPENFSREILFDFPTRQEALDKEAELIGLNETLDDNCYNLSIGGRPNPVLHGENNPFFGKTHSEETREKISSVTSNNKFISNFLKLELVDTRDNRIFVDVKDFREEYQLSNQEVLDLIFSGSLRFTNEDTQKRYFERSRARNKQLEEGKKKLAELCKERFSGKERSVESNLKTGIGVKKYIQENREEFLERIDSINKNPEKIRKTAEAHRGMKRSEETKKRISDSKIGKEPSNKGLVSITNGEIFELVPKDSTLPTGWSYGGKKKPGRGLAYNNGNIIRFFKTGEEIPFGWKRGRK